MATLKFKDPNTGNWVKINADKTFTYEQNSPSNIWIINHNLNKIPSVTILNSLNNIMFGDITYNSNTRLTINFSASVSGKAILN